MIMDQESLVNHPVALERALWIESEKAAEHLHRNDSNHRCPGRYRQHGDS